MIGEHIEHDLDRRGYGRLQREVRHDGSLFARGSLRPDASGSRTWRGGARDRAVDCEPAIHPDGVMRQTRRRMMLRWKNLLAKIEVSSVARPEIEEARLKGTGRVVFVAVLLLMAGTLNIIYGIAAVGNAHFFDGTQYVFSSLHTWGWITIIVGVIELTAGFSLFTGGTYGRVIGIFAASLGALESLLSIGGTHPWWSLAIFFLCVYILHGLIVFGDDQPAEA